MLGDLIESIDGIFSWFESAVDTFEGVFADVDFTLLYSWLPSDIAAVITGILAVFLVLAIIGLVKKLVVFFG